jgi:hypothetical protein
MLLGEPIDPRLSWIRRLCDLDQAWDVGASGPRLAALEQAGQRLGDALRVRPRVAAVRTLPLTTLLYPTKYAFQGSCRVPVPFVVMTHRALLVQVASSAGLKNVLFNLTNVDTSIETPFFRKLVDQYGEWLVRNVLTTRHGTVSSQLQKLGLTPADIDVIAFDHFHTQDLRPLLGVKGERGQSDLPGLYPRALLLAPRREWDDWDHLHPFQQAWFVRDGKRGVPAERVVLTDGDLALGDGCVLLRTPGHTSGNQTIVCHGDGGVFGSSENGTCADNWAPRASRIPGLRETARHQDVEVILNANTPEAGVTQYTSMMLERALVDRVREQPEFFQMFSSSEVTPSLLAPGVHPSCLLEERTSGALAFAPHVGSGAGVAAMLTLLLALLSACTTGFIDDPVAAVDGGAGDGDGDQGDGDGDGDQGDGDSADEDADGDPGDGDADGDSGDGDGDADDGESLDAAHQRCVNRINELREGIGLGPLERWKDAETCSNRQSQEDLDGAGAHGNFGDCGEFGQNTCPGWPGGIDGIVGDCLDAMWSEGPPDQEPCEDQCFQEHGHYLNMASTGFTKVACGFHTGPDGRTWSNQNFK